MEPNAGGALNEEAARLLLEDYEAYRRKANMMTKVHAMKSGRVGNEEAGPIAVNGALESTEGGLSCGENDNHDSGKSNTGKLANNGTGGGLRLSLNTNNVDNKGVPGDLPPASAAAAAASKKAVEKKRAALRRI
ncbi:hypothetical protein, unlikely [Trypanosoma congolense IL3000]|uniref:UBC core domain-containing protein n=1 Tax=Trypanosoma congolense (strain IL3000) TaxID=1068625 RepID=F9W810_TRYCI|nr:hypothetical protein, unlikely [Trypanosoma congolense IL3000]